MNEGSDRDLTDRDLRQWGSPPKFQSGCFSANIPGSNDTCSQLRTLGHIRVRTILLHVLVQLRVTPLQLCLQVC